MPKERVTLTDCTYPPTPFSPWSSVDIVGTRMQYNRERWLVWKWNKKTRVLTLVNETGTVNVLDPYCMRGK